MIAPSRPMPRWVGAATAVAFCLVVRAGSACGLEDPNSISSRRGALNLAFPASLHVGTAVWQAQIAGKLPRDPLAQRDDLTPEVRASLRLMQANATLGQLALRMSGAPTSPAPPSLAIVLLGPVLWTRFEPTASGVRPRVHVQGPEANDVVVVTEIAVIEAIAAGGLGFATALDLGVVRIYGPAAEAAAARAWLADVAPG